MKKTKDQEDSLLIGFAGDLMIGRLVNESLNTKNFEYIWGNVLPILKNNDLNIVNLETALTKCKTKVPKVFNFKADPEKVEVLTKGSIHIVNLANNHVLDYTEKGLYDTLETLDNAKILHVGAGRNLKEAKKPLIITKNGIKIGILGYTDNEPSWQAAEKKPGINYISVGDIEPIKKEIEELRSNVNIVIITIHWGPNMVEKPSIAFVHFAHQLIDLGADIIHGHSAHIFQGVEVYKEKLILYDTGDFVDDYYVDPILRNDRSFFFLVEITKKKILNLKLIPVIISNFQVNLAKNKDAHDVDHRMLRLSSAFNADFKKEEESDSLVLTIS